VLSYSRLGDRKRRLVKTSASKPLGIVVNGVWSITQITLCTTPTVYFKKKKKRCFSLSHDDAQDKNDRRLTIKA